jgi:hypothetical protein
MEKSAETIDFDAKISKQRLDHFETADGIEAVLTITLPNGKELVFRELASKQEAMRVEGNFDIADGIEGEEVEGLFGDIGKALGKVAKGVVKGVKAVASSKVFKAAAKGLAVAAPMLGPLAPAALAASGAMATTSALVSARHAAGRGNKKAAAQFTALAVKTAKKISPKHAATLLKVAADKSRSADAIAAQPPKSTAKSKAKPKAKAKAKAKPKAKPARKPAPAPAPRQLPSSTSSPLTGAALLAAARKGRVYVVQAA